MKKAGIIIPIILVVLLFVAVIVVAKIDVLQTTDIVLDEGYTKYEQLKNENLLDDNNQHIIDYSKSDKVCVSFAENKLMEVEYYLDEAYTNKIDETAYLMPGDTIYFKYIGAKGKNKELYKFSRFEIYEITQEFSREILEKLDEEETQYTIPENIKSKEIQVIPLGKYEKRPISFGAFCSGYDNEQESVNAGIWYNGKTELTDGTLNVGPSEVYTLIYKYNADEYFFVKSSPECFSQNQKGKEGTVEFENADSSEAEHPKEFVVELKRYLKLKLEFDKNAKILLNGEQVGEKVKKYEFTSPSKLKFGDTIRIETKGNIKVTDGDYKYISVTRDLENDVYIYLITINSENLNKKMSEKICEKGVEVVENVTITLPSGNYYGNATYKVNGKEVSGEYTFKKGDKLKVEYTITKKGYIFAGQNAVEKLLKIKTKTETIDITLEMDDTYFELLKYFGVEAEKESKG